MAKRLKLSAQEKCDFLKEVEQALEVYRPSDGAFTKDFAQVDKRATLIFSPIAWVKQFTLVGHFSKEVAWHGVCRRGSNENSYVVEDILVYPQTVTGANVEMDPEEYAKWLVEHGDDPQFDRIRFQGHSHVHMAVTPSSTDMKHQDDIVSQLDEEDYYIFVIWNKKSEYNVWIYDNRSGILFGKGDVDIEIEGMTGFEKEYALVKERKTTYGSGSGLYNGLSPYYQGNASRRTFSQGSTEQAGKSTVTRVASTGYGY